MGNQMQAQPARAAAAHKTARRCCASHTAQHTLHRLGMQHSLKLCGATHTGGLHLCACQLARNNLKVHMDFLAAGLHR